MNDHLFPFRDDDDRYPAAFRAAWKHEFGLDFFSSDHLASLFDRIANPDDYRPPDGIELPPVFDPEAWAKNMLHRFVDTLDSGNMPAAIDNLQRATTTSRGLYPRNEALVMLAYVYLIETGREVTKRSLWLHVNERCKHLGIAPPHKRTRPRLLKKLGLDTLPKGRMVR